MGNVVRLPWPPRQLSPNARFDRRAISGVRKEYRSVCGWEAKAAKLEPGSHVVVKFCPPDARRRDVDNMLASIKSGLDGVASAIGQDDSEWQSHTLTRGPVEKGGAVYIELRGDLMTAAKKQPAEALERLGGPNRSAINGEPRMALNKDTTKPGKDNGWRSIGQIARKLVEARK